MIALATFALSLSLYQPPVVNVCAHGYTQNVWDPRFSPGQRWSYRNRPEDKGSILTIYKIDDVPGIGLVVHISVDGISFDPEHRDMRVESFAIRRDSLDASALNMLSIVQVPSTPDRYSAWQENCGGLTYSSTIADTVRTLQEAYLDRQRTQSVFISLHPVNRSLEPTNVPPSRPEYLKMEVLFHPYEGSDIGTVSGQFVTKDKRDFSKTTVEMTLLPFWQNDALSPPQPPLILKMNADGKFDTPHISPGRYRIRVTLDGYLPDTHEMGFFVDRVREYTVRQVRAKQH